MLTLQDIRELFGKRVAKIAVSLLLSAFVIYFVVEIYTGRTIHDWLRGRFHTPLTASQLLQYQSAPSPSYTTFDSETAINGLDISLPLRLVNTSNQVIFISGIEIQWRTLENFKDNEDFLIETSRYIRSRAGDSESTYKLGDLLQKFEGGYLTGVSNLGIRFADEKELRQALRGETNISNLASFYLPLRLDPYQESVLYSTFRLSIQDKNQKEVLYFVENDERKGTFIKLIPAFFGGRNLQDLYHDAIITFHTDLGTFQINERLFTLFVGTQLSGLPKLAEKQAREAKNENTH